MTLSARDKRCYLWTGYAPTSVSHGKANEAVNAFVENVNRGLVLCHDHFVDEPGGFAIFAIETESELQTLHQTESLFGWKIQLHPLIFSESALRFFYQIDFTMSAYRKQRMRKYLSEYKSSKFCQKLDQYEANDFKDN